MKVQDISDKEQAQRLADELDRFEISRELKLEMQKLLRRWPDGEPVAWQRREKDPGAHWRWVEISKWEYDNCTPHDRRRELFAAPPAKPDGEPVLIVEKEPDYWSNGRFYDGRKPYIDPTKVWNLPIGTKLYIAPQDERIAALEAVIEQARLALEWAQTVIGRPDDSLTADVLSDALRAIDAARSKQ